MVHRSGRPRTALLLGALALLAACATTPPPGAPPENPAETAIAAAILDANRPQEDIARDSARKPAQILALAGVKPGQFVGEMFPGTGYFTRLLSTVVGPGGRVVAIVPAATAARAPGQIDPVRAIAAQPAYGNVSVETPDGAPTPSIMVDVIWTSQNYHDLHAFYGAEAAAAANRGVYAALKPGGVYFVIDHAAEPGSGDRDSRTLHRIDKELVKQEVLAAGFLLDTDSVLLANPADPHTASVFDPAIRGRTDQFVLKFRKP